MDAVIWRSLLGTFGYAARRRYGIREKA